MSIVTPSEYKGENPRIDGIKILDKVKHKLKFQFAKFEETKIIKNDVFLHYKKNKSFSEKFKKKLKKEVKNLLEKSKTGMLAFRRAYLVPGLENPPGPRFLDIKNFDEALEAIKSIFEFAIKHKYHSKPKSKVEAFFYPFTDPPMIKTPFDKNTIFPKGGYAVPVDNKFKNARIIAVFGNHEGVQSLEGYDEYIVDTEEQIILEKIVPQKLYAICTTKKAQDEKIKLPMHLQFKQVLSDFEILEAAMVVKNSSQYVGFSKRVEFSSNGKELFFNEVIDYEIEEKTNEKINLRGRILLIDGPEDVTKIDSSKKDQVIYISKNIVKTRDYSTLNSIASIKKNLKILYPGNSVTAHAMRVLTDSGHQAFLVGKQDFEDGDYVRISSNGNGSKVFIYTGSKQDSTIINLSNAALYKIDDIGGKAFRLGKLIQIGYSVPKGFVIKTKVMNDSSFLKSAEFKNFLKKITSKQKYSVRSSANIEDLEDNAFAGQFDTYLNVDKEDITEKIQKVWSSVKTRHVKKIAKTLNIKNIKMAVIIQEMIEPKFSGVIFGGNIETKERNQIIIEITKGLAADVVDGTGKIRHLVYDKLTGKNLEDEGDADLISISELELEALFNMYIKLEKNFDSLQDVEWTIDKNNDLYLLQSRDLIL